MSWKGVFKTNFYSILPQTNLTCSPDKNVRKIKRSLSKF